MPTMFFINQRAHVSAENQEQAFCVAGHEPKASRTFSSFDNLPDDIASKVVVYNYACMAPSLAKVAEIAKSLQTRWIELKVLHPENGLTVKVLLKAAEASRQIISANVRERHAEARKKGKTIGRKPLPDNVVERIYQLHDEGMGYQEIADAVGITRQAVYQRIKRRSNKAA